MLNHVQPFNMEWSQVTSRRLLKLKSQHQRSNWMCYPQSWPLCHCDDAKLWQLSFGKHIRISYHVILYHIVPIMSYCTYVPTINILNPIYFLSVTFTNFCLRGTPALTCDAPGRRGILPLRRSASGARESIAGVSRKLRPGSWVVHTTCYNPQVGVNHKSKWVI